ncbi:putative sulfate exporter family transporter [Novosphingobium flavum]|uniref:Putative sulfate exporter family transporter n=1 Tax=Novosphingobium flavum TaxID=1778672 RepID=A0A7X1FRV3_9SPHN|nr:putative sulfate exporter family transporter [Novosphingobium flavum]MBC2665212.1 putative sulfate exporter family transporter [Novosphingobium flavum]
MTGQHAGGDWNLPYGGDLFGELQLAETASDQAVRPRETLFPGVAACAVGSAAAAWLSDHYGFPIILLGLLVGLSLNFISHDVRTHRGLDFASRSCLRLGIVVLGLQVTLAQIGALGLTPFIALLAVMIAAFFAAVLGAGIAGQSRYAGILAGGATAICGASAGLALYGVIGKDRLSQAQFALTLVGISLASAFAMSVYPLLAAEFHLSDREAGFLIGASIHDVAQAIGGGYAFSDVAGSYATIVKLARVALLGPIVALTSIMLGGGKDGPKPSFWRRLSMPWFITAFLLVLLINSTVNIPPRFSQVALTASKALLLLAVTATAMRSRMDLLIEAGWRAIIPVVTATLASFAAALAFAIALL